MLKRLSVGLSLLLLTVWAGAAGAVLKIEITQGVNTGIPIAVTQFAWHGQGAPPQDIAAIVRSDLARSGAFAVIPPGQQPPAPGEDSDVNFSPWQQLKANALVVGRIQRLDPQTYQVEFRLYDVFKQQQLAGYRYTVSASLLRATAHQISDIVYQKLTGIPGAFNTRIAYITRETAANGAPVYRLQVADSDGYDAQTIVRSTEPLMSPAWSPDGRRLAYVSFERHHAVVYIQDLRTGRRELVSDFPGINSAPAWSPDSKKLALVLSKSANAQIYVLDLATRVFTRLTRDSAIDTEPAWSPHGHYIVFTSDRSGSPQIFRMTADGQDVERLTFQGSYNARPSYSPDGKSLTLVTGIDGQYHIALLNLADDSMKVLTDTPLDQSPTFAPNGQMILYATRLHGRGVLASVSVDGRVRQLYTLENGDVSEPAWSPFNKQFQYKE